MNKIDPNNSIILLMHDVSQLLKKFVDQQTQEQSLTQTQWRALVHILQDEGCKQKVLADRLDIKPISLSRLLDRLETAGWVERRLDPNDRRASCLYLTEKAHPFLNQVKEFGLSARAKALQGISDEETAVFLDILRKMKTNLSRK